MSVKLEALESSSNSKYQSIQYCVQVLAAANLILKVQLIVKFLICDSRWSFYGQWFQAQDPTQRK